MYEVLLEAPGEHLDTAAIENFTGTELLESHTLFIYSTLLSGLVVRGVKKNEFSTEI